MTDTIAPAITAEGLVTAITSRPLPDWLRLGDNADQVAEFCSEQLIARLLSESAHEVEAWRGVGAPTHMTTGADAPERIVSPLLPALGAWSGLPHHGRVFGASDDPRWAALRDMAHARVNVGGITPDQLKAELQLHADQLAVDVVSGGMELTYRDATDPRFAEVMTEIRETPDSSDTVELGEVQDNRQRGYQRNWQPLRWRASRARMEWTVVGEVRTNVTIPEYRTTTRVDAVLLSWDAHHPPAAWRGRVVDEELSRCWRDRIGREMSRQLAGYASTLQDLPAPRGGQVTETQAARRHLAALALGMDA